MLLTELEPGLSAKITDLSTVDSLVQRRLNDLGVLEGEFVCLKRLLPFGGPCLFEACGQCIGIRRHDASKISVECE
ncbi:ferrous iron transport protein A [Sporolactobacillus sp. THM7-7]|nr:ferrous iron transport protein A [Sporolactobacillus sp. THM7-7]